MKKRSNHYWEQRANSRMASYHKNSDETISKINKAYDKAIADINSDIKKIFNKYAIEYKLSKTEARQLLNSYIHVKDLKSIRDKIKYIQDEDLKKYLMAQLNYSPYKARITRLEALKESIYINTKLLSQEEFKLSTSDYIDNMNEAYYRNIFDIQKGIGLGFTFSEMPIDFIKEVLRNKWSGENYSKRIWNNTDVLANRLEEVITSGLMSGANSRKMAKELNDLTNYGKFASERLIRTETTYVTNMAEIESYKECDVKKCVFLATLDLRTSKICRKMDGKILIVGKAKPGVNLPPLHPFCRSTTIAYLGKGTLETLQRRARDPVIGKNYIINNMNYNEWYEKFVVNKYGQGKTEALEKMIKNKASDKKQYTKYKTILGKEAPKSLKEFQDIKYNNSKEWSLIKGNFRDRRYYNKIVEEADNLNIKGIPIKNIDRIDLKDYKFDYNHINNERSHGVTKDMAQEFINNSKVAYSRWNGQVVLYISDNGCTLINVKDKNVRTSYTNSEYDEKFKKLLEVLKDD